MAISAKTNSVKINILQMLFNCKLEKLEFDQDSVSMESKLLQFSIAHVWNMLEFYSVSICCNCILASIIMTTISRRNTFETSKKIHFLQWVLIYNVINWTCAKKTKTLYKKMSSFSRLQFLSGLTNFDIRNAIKMYTFVSWIKKKTDLSPKE